MLWEKELLGLYVSGHPLERMREKLSKLSMNILQLREKMQPGATTVTAGIIETLRTLFTKSGDQMAFVKLSDFSGSIEAVLFPKVFAAHKDLLKADACVALKGHLSNRNGEASFITDAVKAL